MVDDADLGYGHYISGLISFGEYANEWTKETIDIASKIKQNMSS